MANSGDLLREYVSSTGVRDKRKLEAAILHLTDTFIAQDVCEIAQEKLMKDLSARYLKEWTFETLNVGGHFPPVSGCRRYDGVVETSRAVSARYARRPHVQVVLDGPRGTQFRLAIMLDYKQILTPREMKFADLRINVAIESVPSSLGVDVQRELIVSVCAALKHQYPCFMRKMQRHCSDIQRVLLNELLPVEH